MSVCLTLQFRFYLTISLDPLANIALLGKPQYLVCIRIISQKKPLVNSF
nr:MAG TPA: hypothetical protein [Inoviridae sp.]